MTTYPNDLQSGDLGDVAWPNALKNSFLAHASRHGRAGADPLNWVASRRQVPTAYTIKLEDTTFYADACISGLADYSASNLANLINTYVLPALGTSGGKIKLGRLSANLGGQTILLDKRYVLLEGEFGATWLTQTGDFPLIKVVKPTNDVNAGSRIANLVLKGPGRSNVNAHGIYVDSAWGLDVENIIVGSCRAGIYVKNYGLRSLRNFNCQPIGEWGLGNCYYGLWQNQVSGNGMLSYLDNIEIGFCESHAILLEKVDTIWGTNWRLLESGGSGLKINNSIAMSDLANIQLDAMHGSALDLTNCLDIHIQGLVANAAESTSPGYPSHGIPAGAGQRAALIDNCQRIMISNGHFGRGAAANQVILIRNGSYWITLDNPYVISEGSDGIEINASSGVKILGGVVDAYAPYTKTGIKYVGTAPPAMANTKLIGTHVHTNFSTRVNVAADPNAYVAGTP